MIYIVLGMHKSGTTLVSQILHHSGINMGEHDETISYDRGNKYERESCLALNMDILHLETFLVIDNAAPENLSMTPEQRIRMRQIIRQCQESYDHWGFKDPRTCLTYPLWATELPTHKLIVIYRTPSEIWPRFRYNGWLYAHTNPLIAWKYINRWCEHNSRIVTYLQQTSQEYLVLNYGELMHTQTEFNRLENFVGLTLTDQRKPQLYRSQAKNYPLLNIASWFVQRKTGCYPQKIMAQLEAWRRL